MKRLNDKQIQHQAIGRQRIKEVAKEAKYVLDFDVWRIFHYPLCRNRYLSPAIQNQYPESFMPDINDNDIIKYNRIKYILKANELRLGNLVKVVSGDNNELGKVIKIDSITSRYVNHWQDMGMSGFHQFENIKGIELTDDWLLKLGFSAHISSPDGTLSKGVFNWNSKCNKIYLEFEGIDSVIDYQTDIVYVHQLQNLYFYLTSDELNIQ